MKLRDKLIEETILVPMRATSQEVAIHELLTHLQSLNLLSATIQLCTNIKEQEKICPSSSGRGIAYPHATSIEINELTCVLGISQKGISFNSPDGHDCHLILLTLSSADDPKGHRKFITRFRSMVQNPIIRSSLLSSEDSSAIIKIISQWETDEMF